MASLDEELQQQAEKEQQRRDEFEARQQQDRQQNSPVNQLKNVAEDQVKQAGKKIAKKAIQETIVATAPYWGTALLILAGIALVLFVVIAVPVAVCNSSVSDAGSISGAAATAGAKAIFTASGICSAFNGGTSATPTYQSGGGGGGGGFGYSGGTTDAEIRAYLLSRGIRPNKNNCAPGQFSNCTSLDGMKASTVDEITSVVSSCDLVANPGGPSDNACAIQVTGGTEQGHSETGTCNHGTGNKVDLSATGALNNYVLNPANFTPNGIRSDGAPLYKRISDGAVYADERNITGVAPHWDIAVGCS